MKITKMQMVLYPHSYVHYEYYAIWLQLVRLHKIAVTGTDDNSTKSKWNCVEHTPNADLHA